MGKIIAIFKVATGKLEEELRRGRLTLEVLKQQPGFIAYQAVQVGADEVIVLQTWETRAQFQQGMAEGQRRDRREEEDIIVFRQFFAGEIVTSG